ncbi:MAG: hypothetical protein QXS32_07630 [Candidatus Nezhaarchaeales archaeon]
MVRYVKLDTVLKPNVTYYTGPRQFLRIDAIGTDATSDIKLLVEERPTGAIITDVAPLRMNDDNMLGPLALGNLFYAVPPASKFRVEGPSASLYRVVGSVGLIERAEGAPAEIYSRFETQDRLYVTYVKQTYSHGTDTPLKTDEEPSIFTLQPAENERYIFSSVLMLKVTNATITPGMVNVRFFYEGSPIDALLWKPGPEVAFTDFTNFPYPPTASVDYQAGTLEDMPIEVKPREKFEIKVRNVSGSNITPPSGQSITFTTAAIVVYEKLRR